jgi:hypothetical protein
MNDVTVTATDDALIVTGIPGPPPVLDLGDGVILTTTEAGFEIAGLPAPNAPSEA